MRIQCDNCMKKPASVICCADEAALCEDCDRSIHFANKLSLKHQRVTLFPPPLDPSMCDMCKDKPGFFFCTQDRALLCRDCDVTIHSGGQFKASHTRLLVTGARVGLDALPNGEAVSVSGDTGAAEVCCPPVQSRDAQAVSLSTPPLQAAHSKWMTLTAETPSPSPSMTPNTPQLGPSVPSYSPRAMGMDSPPSTTSRTGNNGVVGGDGGAIGGQGPNNGAGQLERQYSLDFFSEPLRVEDLLGLPQISGYQLGDVASSKADQMFEGQFDWPNEWSLADELRVIDDSFHTVPSMSVSTGVTGGRMGRPPTGAKGKGKQDSRVADYDDGFVVPDIGYHSAPASPPLAKRRRQ